MFPFFCCGSQFRLLHQKTNNENNKSNYLGSYLAGLIEGDGSIIVPKLHRNEKGKLKKTVSRVQKLSTMKYNSNKLNPHWVTGFCDGEKTKIVIFGTNLTSTVGIKFTLKQLAMVQLAPYTRDVIVGLLLSDGWLSSDRKNARLGFSQSAVYGEYFWFVFCSLSHYCSSYPIVRIRSRLGKENISLQFFTRAMPCLTELRSLFYPNGVKIVPYNIYELLTPIALAHMIMGDGSVERHGLIICTNSYSIEDVVRLMNVLIIRYNLECKIRLKKQNQKIEYMIYISQSSMSTLRTIVTPYFHSSMLYKISK